VHPHEIADPSRERRILARLRTDGMLRDPLMVGAVPDYQGYVLLDGTNRLQALGELGCPLVLVQIIDYADEHAVALRTWCHAADVPLSDLMERARLIPAIRIDRLAPLAAGDALHTATTLAVLLDHEHQFEISRTGTEPVSRAEQLRVLVDLYEDRMERMDCGPEEVEERAQGFGRETTGPRTLVAFPAISRSQVLTMAMRGSLIPAGITRHVIRGGRALRVNLPLDLLAAPDPDGANARLHDHLNRLQPRLYREPTILYDS
jgi:hypothetical protein